MSHAEHQTESSAFSLTDALHRLAGERGLELDRDVIHAALGLCWGIAAGDDDTPIGDWPGLARDRFLVPAAAMFGIRVRGLHPPATARNLHAAAEFVQHFDASYRPLIHRALEHGQPVLAWRGWDAAPPLHWGIIRGVSDRGIGFDGEVPTSGTVHQCAMEPATSWDDEHLCGGVGAHSPPPGEGHSGQRDPEHGRHRVEIQPRDPTDGHEWRSAVLVCCPTQVYAVEAVDPRTPPPGELTAVVLAHAAVMLAGGGSDEFGVRTGPAAIDRWISRIRNEAPRADGGASASHEGGRCAAPHGGGDSLKSHKSIGQATSRESNGQSALGEDGRPGPLCEAEGHAILNASLLDAADAGERAIELLLHAARDAVSIRRLAALGDCCRCVREAMSPWPDVQSWQGLLSTDAGRRQVMEHLGLVRERLGSCAVALRA